MRISDWSSDVCSSDLSLRRSMWRFIGKFSLTQKTTRTSVDSRCTCAPAGQIGRNSNDRMQRISDRLSRSEEHTSELQSLMRISYAVFCLKKNTKMSYAVTKQLHTHIPLLHNLH